MAKPRWPVLRVAVPPPMLRTVIETAKAAGTPVSKWCREIIEAALPETVRSQPQQVDSPAVASQPLTEQDRFWNTVGEVLEERGDLTYRELKRRMEKVLEELGVVVDLDAKLLKETPPASIVREQKDDGCHFHLSQAG